MFTWWTIMPIIYTDREIAPPLKVRLWLRTGLFTDLRNLGRLLDFCFWGVRCSPALKLVPTPGRVIVLAAKRVGVHIHRRSD